MFRIWIKSTAALLAVAALAGCATNKASLLSRGDRTMLDIWKQETGGSANGSLSARRLLDARQPLRRPLAESDKGTLSYSRSVRDEISRQFRRLPNPDLVMYVFPHLVGTGSVPVPGYSTVFPFYERVQYAMPGERQENE